jgi:hypothetical protein
LSRLVTTRLLICMVTLAGCEGVLEDGVLTAAPRSVEEAPPAPTPTVLPAEERERVVLPPERLTLLPFEVRLKRLATAVELPVSDAVFHGLRARAGDLGAHDFVNGVAPDLSWTAQRMATWVEGILPVCADMRVQARYADWTTALPAFSLRAWGRASTNDDLADLAPPMGLTAAQAWRIHCVSLLSSAELLSP